MVDGYTRLLGLYKNGISTKLLCALGPSKYRKQIDPSFYTNWIFFHRFQRFTQNTSLCELDDHLATLVKEVLQNPNGRLEARWNQEKKKLDVFISKSGLLYPFV